MNIFRRFANYFKTLYQAKTQQQESQLHYNNLFIDMYIKGQVYEVMQSLLQHLRFKYRITYVSRDVFDNAMNKLDLGYWRTVGNRDIRDAIYKKL